MGARPVRLLVDALAAMAEALTDADVDRLALPVLARLFDARRAGWYRIGEEGMVMLSRWRDGSQPDDDHRYGGFVDSDPIQAAKARHNPVVAVTSDMIEPHTYRRSGAYSELYRRIDCVQHLAVRLSDTAYGQRGLVGMYLSRGVGQLPFTRGDEQDLSRLRPALRSMIRRNRRWQAGERERAALASLVSQTQPASLILDQVGRPIWMSAEAQKLLSRASDGGVPPSLAAAARRLAALPGAEDVPQQLSLEVDVTQPGQEPLPTLLRLVSDPGADASIVVARIQPGGARRPAWRLVAHKFRLTPAELNVLQGLSGGHTNAQIGHDLGISPHTVRTHLMRIFDKMGVHTRTEATSRIWASSL